jgi:hypothetical protein
VKPTQSAKKARAARANGKKGGRPRKERSVEVYARAGAPPKDPLKLAEWMQQLLGISMHRIATDPNMPEDQRRAELRATARAANSLTPRVRLRRAERALAKDKESQQDVEASPQLEEAAEAEDATVES